MKFSLAKHTLLFMQPAVYSLAMLPLLVKSSPLLLLRSFGTVTHSSAAWGLSRSKKESDSSSIEDTGHAYVIGKDSDLWGLILQVLPHALVMSLYIGEEAHN